MKLLILIAFGMPLLSQSIPTLPPVNTLTAVGVTCTFSVVDPQMSIAVECLDSSGAILQRAVQTPNTKGTVIGTGPILCLYWTDGATSPTVRLQCSTDDDTAVGPKLALDGKLAPLTKKRQWWVFWR